MNDKERELTNSINRGTLAKQVLDNPIFQEALIRIRADLMSSFEKTKFKDSDERDEIWREMNTLVKIEKKLKSVMQDGKLNAQDLSVFQKTRNKIGL